MTFDFSRVNWLYLCIGIACWLVLLVVRWRMGNISLADQYFSWTRQNGQGGNHMSAGDWSKLSSDDGGPGTGVRIKAVINITLAFWVILLYFLVAGLGVVR